MLKLFSYKLAIIFISYFGEFIEISWNQYEQIINYFRKLFQHLH